jgi:hypothetical protein
MIVQNAPRAGYTLKGSQVSSYIASKFMTTICRFETLKIGKKFIYSSGKHDTNPFNMTP